ncbi:hypothetical protein CCM_04386 [Cordyceps militaris CM01]|uniref:Uncharacterized protein n=1 Tax=Cordyceps militaris (strain CM01) TaxID=983644 RepID=G3JEQ5_CORMM|nr:uncharacterized protein CCM_04386 [Cordyceps militaris CM01]EGX93014.1 hypothetical protein CCM_04386 [Cordyceps militaris CM01]
MLTVAQTSFLPFDQSVITELGCGIDTTTERCIGREVCRVGDDIRMLASTGKHFVGFWAAD